MKNNIFYVIVLALVFSVAYGARTGYAAVKESSASSTGTATTEKTPDAASSEVEADASAAKPDPTASKEVVAKEVVGQVALVDEQKSTVTVKEMSGTGAPAEAQVNFVVDDKTTIVEDGKQQNLKDLKVGNQVKIRYELANGQYMARAIFIELPAMGR
jgi:hypothetical protein